MMMIQDIMVSTILNIQIIHPDLEYQLILMLQSHLWVQLLEQIDIILYLYYINGIQHIIKKGVC